MIVRDQIVEGAACFLPLSDNAIAIGMAASGLPQPLRRRAI